jgi:hypothetical protein
MRWGDAYFLSATNPLATADQIDVEIRALRILEMPAVKAGRQRAEARIRTIVGDEGTTEGWNSFAAFMEEWTFSYVIKAVISDSSHLRIAQIFTLPHTWFGRSVPGSRAGGGPGPDQAYQLIPIEYGAHYELIGQRNEPRTSYVSYSLIGNPSLTMALANFEGRDIDLDAEGHYRITLGPEHANGRRNHWQTKPGTRYLFIRDCRNDWNELPDARRISRLDPPATAPWSDEQIADLAAEMMVDDVPSMFWWIRLFRNFRPNTMCTPFGSAAVGGLQSQMIFGRASLADDDAFVITVTDAGAAFRDIVLHDYWFNTIGDYSTRTSSLTAAQSAPNQDGTCTYVVSLRDPGIYNWLDPVGLHEVLIAHRWQGLPAHKNTNSAVPAVQYELVKLDELHERWPHLKRVSPMQRQEQRQQRLTSYALRFADG